MKKALLVTALIGTLSVSTIVGYAASTLENQTVKGVQQVTENVANNVEKIPENVVYQELAKELSNWADLFIQSKL